MASSARAPQLRANAIAQLCRRLLGERDRRDRRHRYAVTGRPSSSVARPPSATSATTRSTELRFVFAGRSAPASDEQRRVRASARDRPARASCASPASDEQARRDRCGSPRGSAGSERRWSVTAVILGAERLRNPSSSGASRLRSHSRQRSVVPIPSGSQKTQVMNGVGAGSAGDAREHPTFDAVDDRAQCRREHVVDRSVDVVADAPVPAPPDEPVVRLDPGVGVAVRGAGRVRVHGELQVRPRRDRIVVTERCIRSLRPGLVVDHDELAADAAVDAVGLPAHVHDPAVTERDLDRIGAATGHAERELGRERLGDPVRAVRPRRRRERRRARRGSRGDRGARAGGDQ